jgi:hypothetical protein
LPPQTPSREPLAATNKDSATSTTVNNFDKYYNGQFRQDIQTFFSKVPDRSKHTFDDKKIFTVLAP